MGILYQRHHQIIISFYSVLTLKMLILVLSISLMGAALAQMKNCEGCSETPAGAIRDGKLFFVATSVSTITTTSLCYVAASGAAACTRKKRQIINKGESDEILVPEPTALDLENDEEAE